jgi:hypothetical protein
VAADTKTDLSSAEVDRALGAWRQGDCVLGDHWFVHRINTAYVVTDAGRAAADAGVDLAEQQVVGLVVVSQTCDVVRSCEERPFVEVCPVVEVDEDRLHEIERGRRPSYASLPLLAAQRLVADLDRVMTVENPSLQRGSGRQVGPPTPRFGRSRSLSRGSGFGSPSPTISPHS